MDLQSLAKAYFDADGHNDIDAVAALFSSDASVTDEGTRHEGTAAIRQWWSATKEKYHHVAEPNETVVADGQILVRATVSGRFPGSPASLNYAFTVRHGKILSLEIG